MACTPKAHDDFTRDADVGHLRIKYAAESQGYFGHQKDIRSGWYLFVERHVHRTTAHRGSGGQVSFI